ncbi:hypothetical protein K1719_024192 [Acacia pycnantha]|nr:hypothetical protein K1719_024192 [Acacia pycnantha]
MFADGLKTYRELTGSKDQGGPKWYYPKCPRQPGKTECGYYVIHHMHAIVSIGRLTGFMNLSCRFWPHLNYLNYGDFIFDRKGILSSVYLDEETLHGWKKLPIPFHNLNEFPTPNPITQSAFSTFSRMSTGEDQGTRYQGYIQPFDKWGKVIAFVNEFNLGRYWPSKGPQRNLYVPAPLLKEGDNTLIWLSRSYYLSSI